MIRQMRRSLCKHVSTSKIQCFVCQKFDHFARECNANKKEYQVDGAKVTRQGFDEDNTLLVMITEEEYNSNRLQDECNNNLKKIETSGCNRSLIRCNRLHEEESNMVTMKEEIQCNKQWYLEFERSTHMTVMKDSFVTINSSIKNNVKFADDITLAADGIGDVLIIRRDGGYSLIKICVIHSNNQV